MSTKKIGILTFSYSSNPGSVLQAYALQQSISSFDGCTASIVNYQKTSADKPIIGQNIFFGSVKTWKPQIVMKWIKRMVAYPIRMRKYERFFKNHYNNYPSTVYNRSNIGEVVASYDKFVVGSDQVWNFDSINVDYTYFLDFVKDRSMKISYAASLGQSDIPEREREAAAKLISDFSFVSVREKSSVKTVLDVANKDASWVLDPSLLLDKAQYANLAKSPRKKKYVFLYMRERSVKLEKFAEDLAKCYDLKVVKVLTHWKYKNNKKYRKALGPLEWLGYVQNADFVVTNSFHGICFSIIFEKNFYVDLLKGDRAFTNTRIEELLTQFELQNRSVDLITDLNDLENIDYEHVNAIKAQRRTESLTYLEKALKGNE